MGDRPSAAPLPPRTPATPSSLAIALQAAVAVLLVMLGTFREIIAYFIFVSVIFIAFTVAALFVIRRRPGDRPPALGRGYPWAAIVFLALVLVLLTLTALRNPKQAFLGVAVVGLGWPIYSAFRAHSRRAE